MNRPPSGNDLSRVNSFLVAAGLVLGVARIAVFAAGVVVLAFAGLSVAVRTRRLNPFGAAGRFVRTTVNPVFAPMERRLVRAGGQPAHAPWWTLALVVVGGLALLSLIGFVIQQIALVAFATGTGPRGVARVALSWAFGLLQIALLVRVLGSWVNQGRWSPWTRWAYGLTDWFMGPLQRVVPAVGAFDITPIVAYFGLSIVERVVLGAL